MFASCEIPCAERSRDGGASDARRQRHVQSIGVTDSRHGRHGPGEQFGHDAILGQEHRRDRRGDTAVIATVKLRQWIAMNNCSETTSSAAMTVASAWPNK
jgi:hypothetical protein